MMRITLAACGLAIVTGPGLAADKVPLELKLVGKTTSYPWPYAQTPKEFEASIDDLRAKTKAGEKVIWPAPPTIDLVLRITNTGKEAATIFVEGDPNLATFTVKGPGVVTIDPGLASTTELRLPKRVVLEPGKSHDVAVKWLADGHRAGSRYIYPTAPGEYTLSATYQLSTADGGKGPVLQSDEMKFTIEPKK